jgi:AraC-like DNA-binding protein
MARADTPLHVARPAGQLRGYVSHYWLSLDNTDDTYSVLPDGAVDVVLAVGVSTCQAAIFGTTTSRTDLPLDIGSHYLGIRFKPGQSRHFLDVPASELKNSIQPADGLLFPDILGVAESIRADSLFTRLDVVLLGHLKRRPPRHSRVDDAIRHIESMRGTLRVSQLADMYGMSRRQFERNFLDIVGLPAKFFSEVVRFQQASILLARSTLPLAQIAAELGYSDQSHLTHEFSRFYGGPPSRAREHVAFLQDACRLPDNNEGSHFTC